MTQALKALRGIRVIEFAGLAPAPLAGMFLADFGADVVRVDRNGGANFVQDFLTRGKRSVAIDLKSKKGIEVAKRLCDSADVVIEPFRPGVMERIGLGPDQLCASNPKLVYARLTGYGQHGVYAQLAGHDINYVATSGVLSQLRTLNRDGTIDRPVPPVNLLGDFAGGSLMCVMGIAFALIERSISGKGQVVDAAMVDGTAYLATFLTKTKKMGVGSRPAGTNLLDGGAPFYKTYRTKDDKYMAVGALEPQFYALLVKGLGLNAKQLPDQGDVSNWPQLEAQFTTTFASKTQSEWTAVFENVDACVNAVLTFDEAAENRHNKSRNIYLSDQNADEDSIPEPAPAPKLSRTAAIVEHSLPLESGDHTRDVLSSIGYSKEEIDALIHANVVSQNANSSKL